MCHPEAILRDSRGGSCFVDLVISSWRSLVSLQSGISREFCSLCLSDLIATPDILLPSGPPDPDPQPCLSAVFAGLVLPNMALISGVGFSEGECIAIGYSVFSEVLTCSGPFSPEHILNGNTHILEVTIRPVHI